MDLLETIWRAKLENLQSTHAGTADPLRKSAAGLTAQQAEEQKAEAASAMRLMKKTNAKKLFKMVCI